MLSVQIRAPQPSEFAVAPLQKAPDCVGGVNHLFSGAYRCENLLLVQGELSIAGRSLAGAEIDDWKSYYQIVDAETFQSKPDCRSIERAQDEPRPK